MVRKVEYGVLVTHGDHTFTDSTSHPTVMEAIEAGAAAADYPEQFIGTGPTVVTVAQHVISNETGRWVLGEWENLDSSEDGRGGDDAGTTGSSLH